MLETLQRIISELHKGICHSWPTISQCMLRHHAMLQTRMGMYPDKSGLKHSATSTSKRMLQCNDDYSKSSFLSSCIYHARNIRRCYVHCRMQTLLKEVPSKLLSGNKWWLPNKASVLWSRRSKVFSNHFSNCVWDRTPEWHHQQCFNMCYIFWIQSCCLQWKFSEDRRGETCRIE